jgi:uncharacterized surface protein with fasciclin (FAS1) repeats
MKKIPVILSLIVALFAGVACTEKPVEANFEDQEQMTIYDYIAANPDQYSDFMKILEKGGLDKTLSAYNPHGVGYTLFLPDNKAIQQFIDESDRFSTFDDLLNDAEYVSIISRYHAVNMSINSNDFPFGALPAQTLSDDYLTVSFVIETDTSYYKINNQAAVIRPNIELSNGIIHLIGNMLTPITYTTYDWISQNAGFSIFKAAVDATGLQSLFDINTKDEVTKPRPFSLLVEHDSIYNKGGIHTIEELENMISPDKTDYTDPSNPLYGYVRYHMITETHFLNDFEGINTNYTTYSEIPLNVNGTGIDILVNKGKQVFDTTIYQGDTTYIDYIGLNYDFSNVLTQSGVVHFIDQIMTQQKPSRAIQTFEFYEEPVLNEYRKEPGEYLIEDTSSLNYIHWKGADLTFVEAGENLISAWGGDYLFIDGDFSISYTIPKLVQGNYTVLLGADGWNTRNALIQLYIDGKNVGGLIDLSAAGGSSDSPFVQIELGTINFLKYDSHTIEIKSLIPGRLAWDYIRFEPLL